MKNRIEHLECHIPDGTKFTLRHLSNSSFLDGSEAGLKVKGSSRIWLYSGQAVRALFGLVFLFLTLAFLYIWAWDSGLVDEVATDKLEVVNSSGKKQLKYSFTVEGKGYEKLESPGSTWSSGWSDGGGSEQIIYFKSHPNWATLKFKRERFEPFMSVFALLFVGCLVWSGQLMISSQRGLQRLSEEATHVLLGTVTQIVPGQGFRYVIYEFAQPLSSETLRGSEQVGEAEKVKNSLVPGAQVCVLYADPKTYTLL